MRTGATFRLFGDGGALTAAAVTDRLGLDPSWQREAGTRPTPRAPVAAESCWYLGTDIESGTELAFHLDVLLSKLAPRSAEIWDLVREGYEANWFCYVGSHAAEHAVELDRHLLARLLALPGDLWLDVYGEEPDSEVLGATGSGK